MVHSRGESGERDEHMNSTGRVRTCHSVFLALLPSCTPHGAEKLSSRICFQFEATKTMHVRSVSIDQLCRTITPGQ